MDFLAQSDLRDGLVLAEFWHMDLLFALICAQGYQTLRKFASTSGVYRGELFDGGAVDVEFMAVEVDI